VNQYLLDTNIISELRKMRPHGVVTAWISAMEEARLFVSAVTLGELQWGSSGPDAKIRRRRANWSAGLIPYSSLRVLPMDIACFREWVALWIRSP